MSFFEDSPEYFCQPERNIFHQGRQPVKIRMYYIHFRPVMQVMQLTMLSQKTSLQQHNITPTIGKKNNDYGSLVNNNNNNGE